MKILLVRYHDGANINTRLPQNLNKIRGAMPPLGLLSIAAYLEAAGYNVKVLDALSDGLTNQDFDNFVKEFKPDICGVTTMLENYFGAFCACKIAKSHGAVTVIGGPGLEVYPKEMIDQPEIDYGVVGEGEETFLSLVKAIESGRFDDIQTISGLSYKINGQIIAGHPQVMPNLDLLPRPAYHLIKIKNYSSLINDYPIMTYIMGRGCLFHCSFCIKQESDKLVRFRAPKLVVNDIEYLVSRYRVKEVMFYDDTFTLSVEQVTAVCEEILQRGIKVNFEAPTRIDNLINSKGAALLKLLKKAGCYRLRLGVESGDPDILERMNKKIALKNIEFAFKRCRQAGLQTFAYFMVGYLGENEQAFEKTISLSIKLDPDYVMFTIATPYPTTRLFEESCKAGLVPSDYWQDFIQGRTTERIPYLVPNAEILAKMAYRRFYFRWNYILKSVLRLRSRRHLKNAIRAARCLLFYRNN